jgi:hypothetical protein
MAANLSGPFFERRGEIMKTIISDLEEETAKFGRGVVLYNLVSSIKHPTPIYWTRLYVDQAADGIGTAIHDDYQIVYGPWLEGVGSRNAPVTRFRGYASFRKAAQTLERSTFPDEEMNKLVERLN